jgi:hypothetical protein
MDVNQIIEELIIERLICTFEEYERSPKSSHISSDSIFFPRIGESTNQKFIGRF